MQFQAARVPVEAKLQGQMRVFLVTHFRYEKLDVEPCGLSALFASPVIYAFRIIPGIDQLHELIGTLGVTICLRGNTFVGRQEAAASARL